jgi:hypothetical protein
MNPSHSIRHRARGAALILALIFIAAIAILTMSTLSLSRNQVKLASTNADASRIEIAVNAGFEEAKNLLLDAAGGDASPQSFRGDDYLVTAVREKGKDATQSARYTYILRPEGSAYRAIPLFAGGKEQSLQIGTGADPLLEPPLRPDVDWEAGAAPEELIELRPLTDLLPSGPAKESNHPKTVWRKIEPAPNPRATREERYTYWVEDLQGYPDIASVGYPGLEGGLTEISIGTRQVAVRWGGYGDYDGRLPNLTRNTISFDAAHCLAPDSYQLYYPRVMVTNGEGWRSYQRIAGQVAPGLSSREIPFYPWTDGSWGNRPLFEHPYWRVANVRANQEALASIGSLASLAPFEPGGTGRQQFHWNIEDRFALGLSGYRELPLIPLGFGYPHEGEPRRNLNSWIVPVDEAESDSQRDEEAKKAVTGIASYLREMLPNFEKRKGGFPEDYYKTIAASIIDYADRDSKPTTVNPSTWTTKGCKIPYAPQDDATAYRGMDNFPLVNEFFLKFTYSGYEKNKVFFKATPFAELWNPTNVAVDYSGLQLNFRFLEDFTVKVGMDVKRNITNRNPDGPVSMASTAGSDTSLGPNELRVVRFGEYEYSATFQTDDDDAGFPTVDELKAASKTNAEAHYELLWNGKWIDGSGRMGYHCGKSGFPPDIEEGVHGFEVVNFPNTSYSADYSGTLPNQMLQGDFIISAWAAAMNLRHSFNTTCYGDPRIRFYARGQDVPAPYVSSATPWSRNANRSAGSRDGYSDIVRSWAWADGGYDTAIPAFNLRPSRTGPPLDPDDPRLRAAAQTRREAGYEAAMAPWRISNTGRYYSVTELGNIYDPIMWRPRYVNAAGQTTVTPPASGKLISANLLASNYAVMEANVLSISPDRDKGNDAKLGDRKYGAQEYGGGNSLRIGRLEHPRFDVVGQRACQLLDLFQTGTPGTNCDFYTDDSGKELEAPAVRYRHYMRGVNQPPPTAPNDVKAKEAPYRDLYPEDLYASGQYRWISGQVNINSLATQFEMEALLRGCFSAADVSWDKATSQSKAEKPTGFTELGSVSQATSAKLQTPSVLDNTLNTNLDAVDLRGSRPRAKKTLSEVASKLMMARPFRSPSHLAMAVAQAIGPSDRETALLGQGADASARKASAMPDWASDAVQEEPFARMFNATTLSSRHFRIYVQGESLARRPAALSNVLAEDVEQVVGRSIKVYDVFLQPVRNGSGKIISTQLQILNVRSL